MSTGFYHYLGDNMKLPSREFIEKHTFSDSKYYIIQHIQHLENITLTKDKKPLYAYFRGFLVNLSAIFTSDIDLAYRYNTSEQAEAVIKFIKKSHPELDLILVIR